MINKEQIKRYYKEADAILNYGSSEEQITGLYNLIDEILSEIGSKPAYSEKSHIERSISLIRFLERCNKVIRHPGFYTGIYTDGISLSKDLEAWLKTHDLFETCTYTIHVLKGSKMIKKTYLKDFIPMGVLMYE